MQQTPANGHRWYCHWVNLFGGYHHAIGGNSPWSYANPRGNKKCLAMQPAAADSPLMRYADEQHNGMEPGRRGGGPMPPGANHHLVDSPKLVHLKYGAANWADRPEAKLARHAPETMLAGGKIVDVPADWLWEEIKEGPPR